MTAVPPLGAPGSDSAPSIAPLTPTELADLVGRFAKRRGLWLPCVRFESPDRYYARLERTGTHKV